MDATRRLHLLKEFQPPREAILGALEMIAIQSGFDSLHEMKATVIRERSKRERYTQQPTG